MWKVLPLKGKDMILSWEPFVRLVSDDGIGRDEHAHLATSQLRNSVHPQPFDLLQMSIEQLEVLPHQVAAEVEEECCSNCKKFPNYGKEEYVSTTALVAPAQSAKC